MAEFKVGDRVVALENHDDAAVKGLYGTVKTVDSAIGVEFDIAFHSEDDENWHPGHTLDDYAKDEHGWWIPANKLALADSPAKPDWDWDIVLEEINGIIDIAEQESKRVSEPPKLSYADALKCLIASHTCPYAVLDADGVLYFYSDLPKGIVVFETTAVKVIA